MPIELVMLSNHLSLRRPLSFCLLLLFPTNLLCPWGFLGTEFWSGLLLRSPRDFLNPGTELGSPVTSCRKILYC